MRIGNRDAMAARECLLRYAAVTSRRLLLTSTVKSTVETAVIADVARSGPADAHFVH